MCRLQGAAQRRSGGQGMVAFASDPYTSAMYAVKFYFAPSSFQREKQAIKHPALERAMPAWCERSAAALSPGGLSSSLQLHSHLPCAEAALLCLCRVLLKCSWRGCNVYEHRMQRVSAGVCLQC
jgi:hypothetical protein